MQSTRRDVTLHPAGTGTAALPDGFMPLRVKHVVRETRDAISIVFDVPESAARCFGYQAGQFLTLLACIDGQQYRRCYSMSSSPEAAEDLRITVKRDRDGIVSNWLNDTAAPGGEIYALPPQGRFVLRDADRDLVAFAGGSGITPVFSLLRSALISGDQATRLFYANRDLDSVIFNEALASLEDRHGRRLVLHHHFDDDAGVVTPAHVEASLHTPQNADAADYYICGPRPFMDIVQTTLGSAGVPADRVHLEHFELAEIPADVAARHRRGGHRGGDHRAGRAQDHGGLRAAATPCCRPPGWPACRRRRRAKSVPAERVWPV